MNPFERFLSNIRKTINEIGHEETAKALHFGQTTLIDIREAPEWAQGHIPGAIHLPRSILEIKICDLVPALDTPLILYCSGGIRSALATENLQRMGYTRVRSLHGGLKAWLNADLPFELPPNSN